MAAAKPKVSRDIERLERQGLNVIGVFAGSRPVSEIALRAVDRLRRDHGETIYVGLLNTLTNKVFEPAEAKRLWEEILHHKYLLSEKLKRDVGMRVATLDYLLHYRKMLTDMRMISSQDLNEILVVVNTDGLTGLYNHRYFYERLEEEVDHARAQGRPVSLMMIDIDNFKKYNDLLGHMRGDIVLREAAQLLRERIRSGDIACRYGGDELAVICPGADKNAAREVGESLRRGAEGNKFYRADTVGCQVTFSIGIASFPADTDGHRGLVDLADGALYLSKKRGKNRVTVF
jgi:diguanylate cyclase (GGDEF)-like protein